MAKSNQHLTRSPHRKSSAALNISSSPIAKLLANRPAAVESLVTKVEAISFDGINPSSEHPQQHHQHHPHQHHKQHHHQQQHQPRHQQHQNDHHQINPASPDPTSSSSVQPFNYSPPLSLINSSPPIDPNQRHDELVRDTPTIRQLKTSLRSRLNIASLDRRQRSSEDSGPLVPHSYLTSSTSSPFSSSSSLSSIPSFHNPTHKPHNLLHKTDHRGSLPTSLESTPTHYIKTQITSLPHASSTFAQAFPHLGIDNIPSEPLSDQPDPSTSNQPRRSSSTLPNLHLPFINIELSPPGLALWTVEAYDCGRTIGFSDLISHLVVLPLHTLLAISRKLPGLARQFDLITPLLHQAENENQSVLVTAIQIALGLILASGWKVARKLLSSSE